MPRKAGGERLFACRFGVNSQSGGAYLTLELPDAGALQQSLKVGHYERYGFVVQ